jgi:hypothetical protein
MPEGSTPALNPGTVGDPVDSLVFPTATPEYPLEPPVHPRLVPDRARVPMAALVAAPGERARGVEVQLTDSVAASDLDLPVDLPEMLDTDDMKPLLTSKPVITLQLPPYLDGEHRAKLKQNESEALLASESVVGTSPAPDWLDSYVTSSRAALSTSRPTWYGRAPTARYSEIKVSEPSRTWENLVQEEFSLEQIDLR